MLMGKRRGNGEGSIYQRKDGRWVSVLEHSGTDGKRLRTYFYGDTRKEVADKLKAAHREGVTAKHANARMLLSEYATIWLEQIIKPNKSYHTYTSYKSDVTHMVCVLGHYKLDKLQPQHVQLWLNEQLQTHAISSVQRMRGTLISALEHAIKWSYITKNVAKLTTIPRIPTQVTTALTAPQVHVFTQAAKGERLEALYILAVALGQRKGEYFALQWRDVDFDKATLRINKTLYYQNRVAKVSNTKTKTDRVLPLSPLLVTVLREHQQRQIAELKDEAYHDLGYVFALPNGKPLYDAHLRRGFNALLTKAGLPHIRFHDLRHTCATLLMEQGVHVKIVAALLGHTSIKTTAERYMHVNDNALRNGTAGLEVFFNDL